MNLSTLPAIVQRKGKRLGQGHGSGKVKTSGRGTKGQKARENIPLLFAGSSLQASWLKRLPLQRGKGKNKSLNHNRPVIINVKLLNGLKVNSEVTLKSLQTAGIVGKDETNVKILGDGELKVALTVKLPVSAGAKSKIEKAGGSVTL